MNDVRLHYKVTVRIMDDNKAFGPGVAALLEGIGQCGSLQGAARRMNMSYTKAWTVIKNAERIWGFPLTRRYAGGKTGGGSVLTAQAEMLLCRFKAMEQNVDAVAEREFCKYFNADEIKKLKEMDEPR